MAFDTTGVMATQLAAADKYLTAMPLDPGTRAELADPHLRHLVKLAMCGFAADAVVEAYRSLGKRVPEPTVVIDAPGSTVGLTPSPPTAKLDVSRRQWLCEDCHTPFEFPAEDKPTFCPYCRRHNLRAAP
jgi:hypothetical protein